MENKIIKNKYIFDILLILCSYRWEFCCCHQVYHGSKHHHYLQWGLKILLIEWVHPEQNLHTDFEKMWIQLRCMSTVLDMFQLDNIQLYWEQLQLCRPVSKLWINFLQSTTNNYTINSPVHVSILFNSLFQYHSSDKVNSNNFKLPWASNLRYWFFVL